MRGDQLRVFSRWADDILSRLPFVRYDEVNVFVTRFNEIDKVVDLERRYLVLPNNIWKVLTIVT